MSTTDNAFPFQSFIPNYVNGLGISNDLTSPNTVLDVAAGSIMDSTGTFQLQLTSAATLNNTVNGLGGLDTGAVAASKIYAIYLVADPVHLSPSGVMMSLSYTAPTLPAGYGYFALIGYATVDASKHFVAGYWTAGNSADRYFTYDAPQATSVTAGHATTYANVSLVALVPTIDNTRVSVVYSFTPNAATTSILSLTGANSTGTEVTITGQVASVPVTGNVNVLSQIISSLPQISYTGVSASDTTNLKIGGYAFIL